MNWLKAIGYGIILFALMFVIGSIAMFGLKLTGTAMAVTMMIAGVIVVYLLAKQYGIASLNDGIKVGLVWLVVDALLENIVIVQIFNNGCASNFYGEMMLISYALIVVVAALVGKKA